MNTVYTYYEPVAGIDESAQQAEIAVWRESWARWGWIPVVLGHPDYPRHLSPSALDHLAALPTVNPLGYDLACYVRWWAMKGRGGGLLVDYDVVNIGLRPEDLAPAEETTPILILAGKRVPCAVQLTASGAADWCEMLLAYKVRPDDLHQGRPHISDQEILRRTHDPRIFTWEICQEPREMDLHTKLLHVSHEAMDTMGLVGMRRHDVMRVLAGLKAWRA